jgi:NadR type nicotinamide-nucleotide adenylyltransferase
VIRVCFHGAESTGKSALAAKLGYPWVAEYGRAYCEANGTALTMADLLAIAEGQDAAMRAAALGNPELLVLDTDPLMTAAWAQMLFGEAPDALLGYEKAEFYLLFEADVPWVKDSTRYFGNPTERAHFAAISEAILEQAKVPFTRISGDWAAREAQVRAAIDTLLNEMQSC